MRPETWKFLKWNLLVGVLPVSICFAALSYFVWLPDLSGRTIVVCEWNSPQGHRITVLQIWNNVDFYSTIALQKDERGLVSWVLDGDDKKQWRGSLVLCGDGSVELSLGGEPEGKFYPAERRYRHPSGIGVVPLTQTPEEWARVEKEYGIVRK